MVPTGSCLRKVHTLIKDAYNIAEKWDMIIKNPARLVDAPKVSKHEVRYWDKTQVNMFLNSVSTSRYSAAFITAITTGMRRGEILGLRWRDVNFDEGSLHVTQILSTDGTELIPRTKTSAGRRAISLPDQTIWALKDHRIRIDREKEKELADDLYVDYDLVFCTEIGTPCHPRNLLRVFKEHIKKTGVPNIRFHDLRHTHATLLLKQGANPKIVAERLGHSDVRVTLDLYSHLMPSMQKEVAKEFGQMLFES